jgi:hypothetical protein
LNVETWKDRRAAPAEGEGAARRIHLSIEELLDAWRRAGTPEATIAEAIGRAARASAALSLIGLRMGGERRR